MSGLPVAATAARRSVSRLLWRWTCRHRLADGSPCGAWGRNLSTFAAQLAAVEHIETDHSEEIPCGTSE